MRMVRNTVVSPFTSLRKLFKAGHCVLDCAQALAAMPMPWAELPVVLVSLQGSFVSPAFALGY